MPTRRTRGQQSQYIYSSQDLGHTGRSMTAIRGTEDINIADLPSRGEFAVLPPRSSLRASLSHSVVSVKAVRRNPFGLPSANWCSHRVLKECESYL